MQLMNSGAEGDGDAPCIPVSSGNKSFDMDHALHVSLLGNLQNAHQSDIARHSFDVMGHAKGMEIEKNRRIREEIVKLEVLRQLKLEEEQMIRKMLMEREVVSMPRVGSLVDSLLLRDVPAAPLLRNGDGFRPGIGLEGGTEGRLSSVPGRMDEGGFGGYHLQGHRRSVTGSGGGVKPIIDLTHLREEQVNGAKDDGSCPNSLASSGNKTFHTDRTMHVDLPVTCQNTHQSDKTRDPSDLTEFMIGRETRNRRIREEIEEKVMKKMRMERQIHTSLVDPTLLSYVPEVQLLSERDEFGTGIKSGTELAGGIDGRLFMEGSMENGGIRDFPFQRRPRPVVEYGAAVKPIIDSRKEQLVSVVKPSSSDIAGMKRVLEAPVPPQVVEDNPPSVNLRKKSQEGLICDLCQVAVTCKQTLKYHLNGKKHKAKEMTLQLQGTSKIVRDNDISELLVDGSEDSKGNKVKPSSSGIAGMKRVFEAPVPQVVEDNPPSVNLRKKSQEALICDLCQVAVTCKQIMKGHLNGKKHKAKEMKLQGTSKTVAENDISELLVDGSEDSKGNKDVDVELLLTEKSEEKNASAHCAKEKPKESNADSKFYCGMCNFGTMSEELMADHRVGEDHWSLLQQNGGCVISMKTTPDHYAGANEDRTAGGDANALGENQKDAPMS